MVALKLNGFIGRIPKVAPELLPDNAAQLANNCKLQSGDLVPYPTPVAAGDTQRLTETKTIYALRNPSTGDLVFMSWQAEVNIATPSAEYTDEQRFYYSGDGVPKVSTYALATAVGAPYPDNYYDLGLPLPTTQCTPTVFAFTTKNILDISRSSGNLVTVLTDGDHELRTGNRVTISGFTFRGATYSQSGTAVTVTLADHGMSVGSNITLYFKTGTGVSGTYNVTSVSSGSFVATGINSLSTSGNVDVDIRDFNAVNVEITVTDTDEFTYSSIGSQMDLTTTVTTGKVDLDGDTALRNYVYTWYTPWGEESIASEPSEDVYCKEGNRVDIDDLPSAKPSGTNYVRGIRLYRTVSSTTDTEYYRLATLWFPTVVSNVSRASNVSTVRTEYPHMLIVGDRFKISGCSNSSFNITDGIVTAVTDDNTFSYAQTASNVAATTDAGVLYHDVAESLDNSARYWGDAASYTFTDDFDVLALTGTLDTTEYEAPPEDLEGLISVQNNTLAGFVGKTVYFSEPKQFHAWPSAYAITLEHNVVALAFVGGSTLVLTDAYPYRIDGDRPGSQTITRLDALYPCVAKRSVVSMPYGVVWATHEGLGLYSPQSGATLISRGVLSQDSWAELLDPTELVAAYYGDMYFASHSTGSIIFYREDQRGYIVTSDTTFTAPWFDSRENRLYFVKDDTGVVYEWDNDTGDPMTMEWKSKVISTKDMTNLGAVRILADYTETTPVWDEAEEQWNGAEYTWNLGFGITFKLWLDGDLIYEQEVLDKRVVRLPTGYKGDTYEFGVSANVRIKAIHVGETPTSLKEV